MKELSFGSQGVEVRADESSSDVRCCNKFLLLPLVLCQCFISPLPPNNTAWVNSVNTFLKVSAIIFSKDAEERTDVRGNCS